MTDTPKEKSVFTIMIDKMVSLGVVKSKAKIQGKRILALLGTLTTSTDECRECLRKVTENLNQFTIVCLRDNIDKCICPLSKYNAGSAELGDVGLDEDTFKILANKLHSFGLSEASIVPTTINLRQRIKDKIPKEHLADITFEFTQELKRKDFDGDNIKPERFDELVQPPVPPPPSPAPEPQAEPEEKKPYIPTVGLTTQKFLCPKCSMRKHLCLKVMPHTKPNKSVVLLKCLICAHQLMTYC